MSLQDAGFKVYDVPPDMAGIEALLAAGQRLDPRLSQKARPEAGTFRTQSSRGLPQVELAHPGLLRTRGFEAYCSEWMAPSSSGPFAQ